MNPSALVQAPTGEPQWPAGIRFALVEGAAVVDGRGFSATPGAVLLRVAGSRRGRLVGPASVLAAGTPGEVQRHEAVGSAVRLRLPYTVLLPGLVNAHTHLDLSQIGPRPFTPGAGFMGWIDMVRRERPADDEVIAESVRRGIEMTLAGGCVAVGDIAGAPAGRPSLVPWKTLGGSELAGTSFLEFFAIGRGEEAGLARVREAMEAVGAASGGVRFGLQPHAPNTVSLRGYGWAAGCGLPLATHLAETLAEREFVERAAGPQRRFLEQIGLWDDGMLGWMGRGQRPVQHLASILEAARFVLAHVNDAADEDIALLARTGQTVAYCPRASEYFLNHRDLGTHRYRDMLAAGVPVALGTDSIINLPVEAEPVGGRLSVLDEMRFLWRRDRTDPRTLLAMATVHGATALGLDPGGFGFGPGAGLMGLVAIDIDPETGGIEPLERVLEATGAPRLLLAGK